MKRNEIVNGFAHKYRCSRFDKQQMIEALVLELEELKGLNKTDTQQVDFCPSCMCVTKVLMDEDGNRYCGKCKQYRLKGI